MTYIREHSTKYTSDGSIPSLQDMEKLLKRMKDKRDEILPEHKAFLAKKQVAKQYTQAVHRYRDQQVNKRAAELSRQRSQETARQQEIMCDYQVDRIFSEKLSGANADRPQLRAMLDYVREYEIRHGITEHTSA